MASDDTEITLGMGKLLGLFFLLVAICGVFFSIGYSLGKSTAREQALNDQPTEALAASPPATAASSSEDKPSAVVAVKSDREQPAQNEASTSNPQTNLTFYKAVQQSGSGVQVTPKETPPASQTKAPGATEPSSSTTSQNANPPNATVGNRTAEINHTTPVTGPGTLVVQIAAISREDDAVALAGALRKKNYNVFVVNNPAANDKLYHVQVGPFATMQEAEAMKAKLIAEGYNPIVKR